MEYGLDPALPIYAGGLGILAGDVMKSAGDLQLPLIGIGLLWNQGYGQQFITADGQVAERYVDTSRDALEPVEATFSVKVAGRDVPLRAWRVTRYIRSTLYLIEPLADDDRWITQRLYGGGVEDRVAQEILLGVGGVRLLRALNIEPDVYHFNEGHAVFAGLELIRENMDAGKSFEDAISAVRPKIVFTTHTPVKAGNEVHGIDLLERMGANLGFDHQQLERIGGNPFGMTVAGLRLARRANGVAELHSETARSMWKDVKGAAPIIAITNGVHQPTWQDARIRAAMVPDKSPEQRRAELWTAHQEAKAQLIGSIERRSGVRLSVDRLLVGFARRAATYKRADLIFGDLDRLSTMMNERGLQLVFAGKAHPADGAGKALIARVVEAARRYPEQVVYLDNYDMTLGAMLTRGCDVWLNNPRRPKEASGTSGMKAAMNGVPNLSILDGWWPEGCRHGETGWQIGDGKNNVVELSPEQTAELDQKDRDSLYRALSEEVIPRYYNDRDAWVAMMENSINMSAWRFSSDRMVQDYYRLLYAE